MKVAVYCGSKMGQSRRIQDAVIQLGYEMAKAEIDLVYGGGRVGLMGLIADTLLGQGRAVDGVIPRSLFQKEVAHLGLTQLHEVANMHERKALMEKLSDAFIILPGGFGTMDEFFEIITWKQIGVHKKPIGLLNIDGFYDALLVFMKSQVAAGFVLAEDLEQVIVSSDPQELVQKLQKKLGSV
ncbi:MAG: TIGR00730 family Rossman fold protein [Proteobacteria bacterium]|jgi:hypothetical protein|nr:TIGR00730 family Rossman fold protein [Pseudomonadota bacterium]